MQNRGKNNPQCNIKLWIKNNNNFPWDKLLSISDSNNNKLTKVQNPSTRLDVCACASVSVHVRA